MKRPFLALLILLAAALGAGQVAAQSAPPSPALRVADASNPPVAPTTTAPASGRAVSPQAAALLGVVVPKYVSPAPADAKSVEEPPDLREIDRPRNTIIRLPKYLVQETRSAKDTPDLRETDQLQNGIVRLPPYVVQESRPPVFREQDIYTPQALGRRLARRYYSEGYLVFSRFVHYTPLALFLPSAEASAMAQFEEDERLRNKVEFSDYANWLKTSNPTAGAKLKTEAQQTFMHWSDLGWSNKPK